MTARILPADDAEALREAARLYREGDLFAFPTDTFYALGADPFNGRAMEVLYRLKGRPTDKPVLLLVGDAALALELWEGPDPGTLKLMERFWPGPLTIIAPPSDRAPRLPGKGGLALRLPGNPWTASLARALGGPVTGTSANPAGEAPPSSAGEVESYFPRGLDLILDGGTSPGERESTIIRMASRGPEIIREGAIAASSIEEALEG